MKNRQMEVAPRGEGLEELVALLDRLAALGRARQRRLEHQQQPVAEGEGSDGG